jgi:hypothetical protein
MTKSRLFIPNPFCVPSAHDVHRSPWGNLSLQPGPLRGRSSTTRCCRRQHSSELFRCMNCSDSPIALT